MGSGKGSSKRVNATVTVANRKIPADVPINWKYKDQPLDYNTKQLNYTYVNDRKGLAECVKELKNAKVIGFDIETTGFSPPYGNVRLMQFAVDDPEPKQWVVDCFDVDPEPLLKILGDPNKETVIHYANFEQAWLYYHYNTKIGRVFDTCVAARKLGALSTKKTKSRLKDIARRYLNKHVDKAQQNSYWDARTLSEKQVKYAAMDAALLLDLVNPVKKDVIEKGAEKEVERDTNSIYYACKARIDKAQNFRDDELSRVIRVIQNAESVSELQAIKHYSREVSMSFEKKDIVTKELKLKRDELTFNS